ncbi:hypothetical protein HY992_03880 [Candidatus Micrarchaeota archaeon]|nr:hypothetical protein [Candidatus Micrarchaeota archaeon]
MSEGKEKTKKMSGEELGQLLNSLVGMSEDERRVRVAGLKFEGYVGMRDPETHMLAGNIGNPVVELEKISYLRNCSYYARKRMTV